MNAHDDIRIGTLVPAHGRTPEVTRQFLPHGFDLPPLNGTASRERIWGWIKPREATNTTRKEGID
jgi:hypothetical protein